MGLFIDFLWFWFRVATAPLVFAGAMIGFIAFALFSFALGVIMTVVTSTLVAVAWVAQP